MNRRSKYVNEKGYTLIEIIIVIVILGIVGGITFQFVAHGVEAFKKSRDRKDLYDQGRLALERMTRELRDAKEVTASGNDNITFKVAHPSAYGVTEEIKYQLNGTDLERVADPSTATPPYPVLASNVSSFTVTPEDIGGGGGTGTCSINFDGANSGSGSGSQLTFSHTIGGGSNRLLVVSVGIENGSTGPTVDSITYGGQSLTKIDSAQTGSTTIGRSELWYALETNLPSAGSYNVEVNVSASVSYLLAGAISLDGVAQQGPEDQNTRTVTGTDNISTSITTVTNGAWIVDSVHCGEAGSYTANSGQAERYEPGSTSSTHAASTLPMAIAGSTSISWTHSDWNANRQTHVVAAFAPATDCAGSTVAGNLVMVVGSTTLSTDDQIKSALFEGWGWTVTAIDDGTADYSTAAANNDVMYISESASGSTVGTKATNLDIGVVSEENLLDDDMEFSSSPVDRADVGGTQIDIVDNSHYITSTFSTGVLTIYTSSTNNYENRATVASGAEVLAEGVGSNYATLMAFDTGATLDDLSSAVNRRVGLTAFNQSDPTLWNNDARTLVMRALDWAAGAGAGNLATLELTLTNAEGGTVTMRTKVFLRNVE